MPKNGETKKVGVRFPLTMVKAMEKYIDRDTHLSQSDLIRNAVRFYLEEKGHGVLEEVIEGNKREEKNTEEKEKKTDN